MPDWPALRNTDPIVLSTPSPWGIGSMLNAMGIVANASLAWPVANKAYYIPVSVHSPLTIVKMSVINGTVVSGNIDVGIYDAGGALKVSKGSTAQAGTSAIQEFDITDTLLLPGLYCLAAAMDNTTGTLECYNPAAAIARFMGVCEQTTAFALPSTATFAALSGTNRFPWIGAHTRSQI